MNQQQIQLLLDLKVRGEQEVQQDFARVAAEMSKIADGAFAPLAENLAKKMAEAMKGALDQIASQNIVGSAMDRAFKQVSGQEGPSDPSRGGPSGGQRQSAQPQGAPQGPSQQAFARASQSGYYSGPMGPAGVEMGGSSGYARELAELSGRNSPEVNAMGGYARARRQAQQAGVELPGLTDEEKGRFKSAIDKGREDIGNSIAAQAKIVAEIEKLGQEIKGYTAKISQLESDTSRDAADRHKEQEQLAEKQKQAVKEQTEALAKLEGSRAFVNQTRSSVVDLQGQLPADKLGLSDLTPSKILGRLGPAGIAGAIGSGLIGASNLDQGAMARVSAGAERTNVSGRAYLRGDLQSLSSIGDLGGDESLDSRASRSNTLNGLGGSVATGAGIFGAATGLGALAGTGIGGALGLGGMAVASTLAAPLAIAGGLGYAGYRYLNRDRDTNERRKALVAEQTSANEEQRASEAAMVSAGTGTYAQARDMGMPEAAPGLLGTNRNQRMSAARAGVSGAEYESIAARVARAMGTQANGDGTFSARSNTAAGAGASVEAARMAGQGYGNGADLFSALYNGGMRGQGTGAGEATDAAQKVIEDALKNGIDKSKINDLLGSIAENTSRMGLGGSSGALAQNEAVLRASSLAYNGNEVRGPEFDNMQRGIGGLLQGGRDQGGGLSQLVGLAETDVLGGELRKADPRFKGLSTKQRRDMQELGTTPGALRNIDPNLTEEQAKSLSDQYMSGGFLDKGLQRAGFGKNGDVRDMVLEDRARTGGYQPKSLEELQAFDRGARGLVSGAQLYGPQNPAPGRDVTDQSAPAQLTAADAIKSATLVTGSFKDMNDMLGLVNKGLDSLQKRLNEGTTTGGFWDNLFGGKRNGSPTATSKPQQ